MLSDRSDVTADGPFGKGKRGSRQLIFPGTTWPS